MKMKVPAAITVVLLLTVLYASFMSFAAGLNSKDDPSRVPIFLTLFWFFSIAIAPLLAFILSIPAVYYLTTTPDTTFTVALLAINAFLCINSQALGLLDEPFDASRLGSAAVVLVVALTFLRQAWYYGELAQKHWPALSRERRTSNYPVTYKALVAALVASVVLDAIAAGYKSAASGRSTMSMAGGVGLWLSAVAWSVVAGTYMLLALNPETNSRAWPHMVHAVATAVASCAQSMAFSLILDPDYPHEQAAYLNAWRVLTVLASVTGLAAFYLENTILCNAIETKQKDVL